MDDVKTNDEPMNILSLLPSEHSMLEARVRRDRNGFGKPRFASGGSVL